MAVLGRQRTVNRFFFDVFVASRPTAAAAENKRRVEVGEGEKG